MARGSISLIAKGPIKNVRREASRRGLGPLDCRVVGTGKFGDVQCYTPCTASTNSKVAGWYGTRNRAKAGRGFPPGTLLYHGAFCSKNLSGARSRKRKARR